MITRIIFQKVIEVYYRLFKFVEQTYSAMSQSDAPAATLPEKAAELFAFMLFAFMWLFLIWSYSKMPAQIPTHFDGAGKPDAWSDKGSSFILPVIGSFVYLQMSFVVRLKKSLNTSKKVQVTKEEAYYRTIGWFIRTLKILVMGIFAWITVTSYTTAIGKTDGIGTAFLPISVAVILGVVTYFIVRLRKFKPIAL